MTIRRGTVAIKRDIKTVMGDVRQDTVRRRRDTVTVKTCSDFKGRQSDDLKKNCDCDTESVTIRLYNDYRKRYSDSEKRYRELKK